MKNGDLDFSIADGSYAADRAEKLFDEIFSKIYYGAIGINNKVDGSVSVNHAAKIYDRARQKAWEIAIKQESAISGAGLFLEE